MKKEQLLMMMAILFSIGLNAQSTYTMDDKWYNIYAYMYYMQDDSALQMCDEPKQVYSQLQKQAYEQQTVQLLHFNFPLDSTADADLAAFAEYGNIHKDNGSISGVSLFMPNTKVLRDDCTLTIQFPAEQLFECEQYYWNLPQYQLYEYNQYKKVNSITIMNDGKPLVTDLIPGGSFEIDLHDIYRKNLKMEVKYDNGQVIDYVFRMDASKYDWGLCGPPPVGDPVNPDDWPCIEGPDDDPYDPTHNFCGVPPPPKPPTFDEDCLYQPDEVWEVVAEIEYKEDHPYYQVGGFFNPLRKDYKLYGNASNPAVYEGASGGPIDKKYRGVIDASVYLKPGRTKVQYPIIITDGIDFLSNRSSGTNLQIMGGSAMLQKLFDGGYDVVMVDFKGGADFMQKNAFALVELIRRLRQDEGVETIPAIIGPSMGGQITRYSLLYWEQNLMNTYGPYNIETFLSADSPWKGANASPAIQCVANVFSDVVSELLLIDKMSNSPAARQLLIHQVYGLDKETNLYDGIEHPFKTTFDTELLEMGDYPKNTKIVAIADGGNGGSSNYESQEGYDSPNPSILEIVLEDLIDIDFDFQGATVNLNRAETGIPLVDLPGVSSIQTILWPGILNTILSILVDVNTDFDLEINSLTMEGLDNCPGSPFRLQATIDQLGVSGIKVLNTFSFVPTFSALGISTSDVNIDVTDPENQSPYFEEVFVDDMDSGHNDFHQDGTIDFFLQHINYQSGYDQDICEFIENSVVNQESPFSTDGEMQFDVEYSMHGIFGFPKVDISLPEFCQKDLRLINENNEVVSPDGEFIIISDPCGIGPIWDFSENQPDFPNIPPSTDGQDCTILAEICFTHPLCPDVNIPCQEVQFNLVFDGDFNSPISDAIPEVQTNVELGKQMEGDLKDIIVFPNPSKGKMSIQLGKGEKTIELYDSKGMRVLIEHTQSDNVDLDLNAGVYLLRVYCEADGSVHLEKIVVL